MPKKVRVKMVRGPHGEQPRPWEVGPPFLPEGYTLTADWVAVSPEAAAILTDPENEDAMRGRVFVVEGASAEAAGAAKDEPATATAAGTAQKADGGARTSG